MAYDTLLNDNEIVLLGLLVEGPRYGYEIDKLIAERGMREWTNIAFSSIYAVLRTLEKKGLVESKTELAGNRARRLYSVTKAGKRTLKGEVVRLISDPVPTADSFLLGIANVKMLEKSAAEPLLAARQVALNNIAAQLEGKKRQARGDIFVAAIFNRTLAAISAEIRFLDELRAEMGGSTAESALHAPSQEVEQPAVPQPEPEPKTLPESKSEPKDTLF